MSDDQRVQQSGSAAVHSSPPGVAGTGPVTAMTSVQPTGSSAPAPSDPAGSLADVVDTVLDKGLVIDANVSVSVIGVNLATVDARVTIASVDTYLRFAEAVNRLDLGSSGAGEKQLGDGLGKAVEGVTDTVRKAGAEKALGAAGEAVGDVLDGATDEGATSGRRKR